MSAVVADSGGEEDGRGVARANNKVGGEWFEPLQEKGTHIKFHWNEEHGWCEGRVTKPMRKILTKTQIKWVVTVHFDDGETNTVNFLKSEEHRWRFLSSPIPTTTTSSSSNAVSKTVPKKARNPTSQKRTQKESSSVKESDGPKTTKRAKKTASKTAKKPPVVRRTKNSVSSSSVSEKVSKRIPLQALDQNQGEPPKELDKTFVGTKPGLQDTPCDNKMSKDDIPEEDKTTAGSPVEETLDPVRMNLVESFLKNLIMAGEEMSITLDRMFQQMNSATFTDLEELTLYLRRFEAQNHIMLEPAQNPDTIFFMS
eukprot:CAMPEP_0198287594 /NCGR_PEP_ID=MMETSP1449-20131203/6345_1 /TAXON_ID=420275 /ORGANISM="Attheya septentrionalis, Strain CCMP2084" /LENGTH=311 /DNA_ID=CAMNT_0043985559 /DNA_START=109 /DNA_END=1044 /DNA_ORIENTATION=+